MKLVAGFVLLACCAFGEDRVVTSGVETAACGPRDEKLAVKIDQSQHPTPAPPDGKALVYVVDQEIHDNIGVDGKWAGANDRGTYFFVAVDPGEHHLCAYATYWGASWISLHSLQAKAGETYYFLPIPVGNGGRGGKYTLEQLDPDEGRYLVSKARFATSQPR
jgi:hypothetical protein